MDWRPTLDLLVARGHAVEPGLTPAERARAEERYGFRFPPDLAALLSQGVPAGDRFPRWRALDETLVWQMEWPTEGLLGDLWLPEWGERPTDPREEHAIATAALRAAPVLVPLYAHRYLPADPCEAGNPVFSVYGADTIHYGTDLASYFENEFGGQGYVSAPSERYRRIRFWTALVEANG